MQNGKSMSMGAVDQMSRATYLTSLARIIVAWEIRAVRRINTSLRQMAEWVDTRIYVSLDGMSFRKNTTHHNHRLNLYINSHSDWS